jgi:shikimate dehydrogenase
LTAREISGATRVAGAIGSPLRHSLSPALHNAAFAAAGVDWVYAAFEVPPGATADAVTGMRALGLAGLSVTMPHKEAIIASLDELDPTAAVLRSVNTVVVLPDGRLRGCTTDGDGFVASIREAGADPAGRRVAVLGAGGAGRAVVEGLRRAGAAEVVVVNRSGDRAEVAAALAGDRGRVGHSADVRDCDIVVNATSVGMGTTDLPLDVGLLHDRHVVADLVYHPLETSLLAHARAQRARVVDGLGMLVHQAALQQELWLGRLADTRVMREAALRELARRAAPASG